MDIKMFKQQETKRTIKCKSGNKNINIQIINYTQEIYDRWKVTIQDMYTSGIEEIQLSDAQLVDLFNDLTNIDMTIDELNSILDNPSNSFKSIFREVQIVLTDMVTQFLQEKQLEIANIRKTLEETNVLVESERMNEAMTNITTAMSKLNTGDDVNG